MIVDKTGGLRASVAVIDANKGSIGTRRREGGQRTGFDLALILEEVVGLDNGHGEITKKVVSRVFVPEKAVLFAFGIRISVGSGGRRGPETRGQKVEEKG